MLSQIWSNFRDELVATSLVLAMAVGGSFFIAYRLLSANPNKDSSQVTDLDSQRNQDETGRAENPKDKIVLGDSSNNNKNDDVIESKNDESKINLPTPTMGPYIVEVPYGLDGKYTFDDYVLEITEPKIQYDQTDSGPRKLIVEMVLRNISITKGLSNKIEASIVKDGNVIVPKAAMSVSESKLILPKEQITFEARLSLIDGTDVKEIFFSSENSSNKVVHTVSSL